MSPERFEEIRQAFDAVANLPEKDRPPLLEQIGARDPALRASVERLLQAHSQEHPLLDRGGAAALFRLTEQREPMEGRHVGAYRLLEQIAVGGMGTVYE